MIENLCVIIPLYNDWPSFSILLQHLDEVAGTIPFAMSIVAVDDGSSDPIEAVGGLERLRALASVQVVHLAVNVGHQRAIAIGLCAAFHDHRKLADAFVVMDGDGEDAPEQIPTLLHAVGDASQFYVVAQRQRRTENLVFRVSYGFYKAFYGLVTGKKINFGNFSAFSRNYAKRLVLVSELWNNLPSAVLRSRIPFQMVPLDRSYRYAGRSKMNFVSLVVHGLSGISVYADAIFVRLLLLSMITFGMTSLSVMVLLALRIFYPHYATPGWATTVSFGMIIILLQIVLTALSSSLMLLNSRVQRQVMPLLDYKPFIASRRFLLEPSPISITTEDVRLPNAG